MGASQAARARFNGPGYETRDTRSVDTSGGASRHPHVLNPRICRLCLTNLSGSKCQRFISVKSTVKHHKLQRRAVDRSTSAASPNGTCQVLVASKGTEPTEPAQVLQASHPSTSLFWQEQIDVRRIAATALHFKTQT